MLTIEIPGFKNQKIELALPGFFKGVRLLVNGQPAPAGEHRGQYRLTDDSGKTVTARFRNQLFGLDYPQLVVDKQIIDITPPLKWYLWIFAILPFLLVTFGGAMGGLIGLIATWANVRLLRQPWHLAARLAATLGVTLLAVVIWFLAFMLLYDLKSG